MTKTAHKTLRGGRGGGGGGGGDPGVGRFRGGGCWDWGLMVYSHRTLTGPGTGMGTVQYNAEAFTLQQQGERERYRLFTCPK